MKKQYMIPTMRIVALRHRTNLLSGSPRSVNMYRGSGNPNKEGDDTLGDDDEIF